ncbi:uncharacterized protein RAG0_09341 [Rhynchosporium agropyri]|uniref:Uncharacterized protein n=1 Tax=Rhynchosporium agropyri TaxID=914238 RepID=A0A1E1KV55_9HELO|nr:uncharacterized protein RAG0_09341 [Rhynchosporium agropyri]
MHTTTTLTTCSISTIPSSSQQTQHHLEHTQQTEEFLIEQYTQVLEALEAQYTRLSKLLLDIEEGSFEGRAIEDLLESVREAMRCNDVGMAETRRDLWRGFWEDGADGEGAEVQGPGEMSGDGTDIVK